jgi:hypothetical protein
MAIGWFYLPYLHEDFFCLKFQVLILVVSNKAHDISNVILALLKYLFLSLDSYNAPPPPSNLCRTSDAEIGFRR